MDLSKEQMSLVFQRWGVTPGDIIRFISFIWRFDVKVLHPDNISYDFLDLDKTLEERIHSIEALESVLLKSGIFENITLKRLLCVEPRHKHLASELYEMGYSNSRIVGVVGEGRIEGVVEEFGRIPTSTLNYQQRGEISNLVGRRYWRVQWFGVAVVAVATVAMFTTLSFLGLRKLHRATVSRIPRGGQVIVPLGCLFMTVFVVSQIRRGIANKLRPFRQGTSFELE